MGVAGLSIWSTPSAELVYRHRQFGEGNVAPWQSSARCKV
jgi:hypothetical protein